MRYPRAASVVAFAVIALGLGVGLTACSDDSDGGGSVPVYHDGDSITVDDGDEFVIALEANPSTGYTWGAGENANVELVSSKQTTAKDAPPGASGTQRMTFKAYKDRQQHARTRVRASVRAGRTAGEDHQLRRHGAVNTGRSGMPLAPPSGFTASTWCTWTALSSKRAALAAT